ncbi:MAG: transcriptional regulator with XRE-family HTH domain [Akkermansiaceae bacterium]|jgi:transcriptional regulator with XRE-family HTH domain
MLTTIQIPENQDLLEKKIGKNLKAFRLARNLSQQQLSEKAGLSRRTITSIENGQGSTLATLIRIVRALDQEHLIGRLLEPPPISPTKLHQANQALKNTRKKASKPRKTPPQNKAWNWGNNDEI